MLSLLLAMLPTASAADPLIIMVADPSVSEVVLDCAGETHRSAVRDSMASFTFRPDGCTVKLLTEVGKITGPARYACDRNGCTEVDVIHQEIINAEGRLTVVLTDESTRMFELKCTGGHRARANVVTNTAVFDGVPNEECDLLWKGGNTPAKAFRLRTGTYYCSATGGTGICTRR